MSMTRDEWRAAERAKFEEQLPQRMEEFIDKHADAFRESETLALREWFLAASPPADLED
jgi:hypothetical protein